MLQSLLSITKIELHKLSIPLIEPFVISLGPIYDAENVVVIIHTDKGITGWGECSPFLSINGESADTGLIVGKYFEKVLTGKNALDIEGCITEMDKVIYGNNSIKSAFDIALYDIAAKYNRQPLYKFLGGKKNKQLITDYTVSVGETDKMANAAIKIVENGFKIIKVKLGKSGNKDVERIEAIRNAIGMEIPLRIDANQGWSFDEALETLQKLEPYNIQYCEEPISRAAFMRLAELNTKSPIPIMADESCGDLYDLERLIHLKACDYINIKLGKSGGIFNALKMIKMAEAAGLKIQLGAFMESRLAMTAFAHLALCSPHIEYYDFDTSLMFTQDPVNGGMIYKDGGVIEVPAAPGIGAEIKKAFL
jgi:L-Ala-D/L-Glu epimerase